MSRQKSTPDPAKAWVAAGVDGCKSGWVCAGFDGGAWTLSLMPALKDIVARMTPGATVCIDMPIGLSADGFRACDREARRLLGPRRSSVFPAPPRLAIPEAPYEAINARSKKECGKGVSKQAFYLLPKIREVEHCVLQAETASLAWLETHPELCFASLNAGIPMTYSKKTSDGYGERFALIARFLGRRLLGELVASFEATVTRSVCARDDILDAMVCAVVAHLEEDQRGCVPADANEFDEVGLPMRIYYPKDREALSKRRLAKEEGA